MTILLDALDDKAKELKLADKMQKFMATECARWGNETSEKLYGYQMFEDPTYFPYRVYSQTLDTKDSTQVRDSYVGIERQGFTKALQSGAENTLVVDDIFDVFVRHVEGMANYHGYALANKDILRVLNYRQKIPNAIAGKDYKTSKQAINNIVKSDQGVSYIETLLLDINKATKSAERGLDVEKLTGKQRQPRLVVTLELLLSSLRLT